MGRQHDGSSIADELTQGRPHRLAGLDVETHRGFVQEQQPRPAADRHGELHLALLAIRQLSVGAAGQRGNVSHLHHHFGPGRIRVVAAYHVDLFADAQVRRQRYLLHHHAHLAPRLDQQRREAEQARRATVGLPQPQHQGNGGGLSRPVRAEDGQQLSGPDLEVKPVQREDGAEAFAHSRQLRQGIVADGHGLPPAA